MQFKFIDLALFELPNLQKPSKAFRPCQSQGSDLQTAWAESVPTGFQCWVAGPKTSRFYKMLLGQRTEDLRIQVGRYYISTLKPEAFCGILIISDIPHYTMIKSCFLNQTKLHLRVLFFISSKPKLPRFVDTVQEKIPIETTLCW